MKAQSNPVQILTKIIFHALFYYTFDIYIALLVIYSQFQEHICLILVI